ncbi:MAG: DMT family transporter [Ruminococcaceae bacterium]|nr:DMT family transporter [Oscillospiraceae bacterium]
MQNYLILLAASLLLAGDFAIQKIYQQRSGTGIIAGLTFNTVVGAVTAVLFFILGGFSVNITCYGLIMAGSMSICVFVYTIIGFRILRDGNMALYTLFLMTGGMVAPFVYGIAFLEEVPTPFKVIGMILVTGAVVISNLNIKSTGKYQLFLCVAVLFLNGACSILSKLGQTDTRYGKIAVYDFVCMTGIVKFVICGIALALYLIFRKSKDEKKLTPKILPIIALSAIVGGVSYMLQLMGAERLPASVLFPMVSGGSMIFSTLTGIIFFKEKPTKWQISGVVICFLGTLFLL